MPRYPSDLTAVPSRGFAVVPPEPVVAIQNPLVHETKPLLPSGRHKVIVPGTACIGTFMALSRGSSYGWRVPLRDRLRRLDSRVFNEIRKPGEDAETYLRRVAASGGIPVRDSVEVHRALRQHFAALDAERRR